MRQLWKSAMISLAGSPRAKRFAQEFAPTSALVSKFVAGPTAAEGIQRARALLKNSGINGSLCYLGGYVDHLELVEETMTAKL